MSAPMRVPIVPAKYAIPAAAIPNPPARRRARTSVTAGGMMNGMAMPIPFTGRAAKYAAIATTAVAPSIFTRYHGSGVMFPRLAITST